MKVITVLPVKNEAWVLPCSLENFSQFSDHIIIADQHSTDGSREIYKRFPKVTVIDNNFTGHSNKIRWDLLAEARKIPGNNLIICLDADELLSPKAIEVMKTYKNGGAISFRADWIQLIGDGSKHRVDGAWKKNIKAFAFIDDRSFVKYEQKELLIDHTARIPDIPNHTKIEYPILHLHYMAKSRSEIKQAWYMCTELLGGVNPRRINNRYSTALFRNVIEADVNKNWVDDVTLPPLSVMSDVYAERQAEVLQMFSEKGICFFESLDIWHIPKLKELFINEVGREPKPKFAPKLILYVNDLKNNIKNYYYARFR